MPNRLIHSTSPYLLQHAHNPVDWFPWGSEALEKAQNENKLLIISIGYAACHWCHVMEHESFMDTEVAEVMNNSFVSIKVDREERPDLDKTYIEAVQLMTGQGGWPLNCVALPDGRPIWGGTYFSKANWLNALRQLATLYTTSHQEVLDTADNVLHYMLDQGNTLPTSDSEFISELELNELLSSWMERIDFKWGGRKVPGNKFPVPGNYQFLVRAAHFTQNPTVQKAIDTTLEKMAFGGIYDHLGGGFARYSVDPYWKVPHFEKMLYDNGQLVSLYAEAYLQKPRPLYKKVVEETLGFVQRELMSPEGGFYSSLDADSEGEEGKFYTWQYEEIETLLGKEARLFADFYNAHPFGNWEGKNILFVLETEQEFAERWNLDIAEFSQKMQADREKLFQARSQRIRPGLDDKVLCSWNALMLKGYIDAYRVWGEAQYLEVALANAEFLRNTVAEGGKLFRTYKNGTRSINGFLDDYAFLIDAFLALYQITLDESWLHQAHTHMEHVWAHFGTTPNGMFYYSSDEDPVMVKRHIEIQDDVIPGSNSQIARALWDLGTLFENPKYRERASNMLLNTKDALLKSPDWHAHWGILMLQQVYPCYEVAITGPKFKELRSEFIPHFLPHVLFAGAEQSSELAFLQNRISQKSQIFVCQNSSCKLPTEDPVEALRQLGVSKS